MPNPSATEETTGAQFSANSMSAPLDVALFLMDWEYSISKCLQMMNTNCLSWGDS